MTIDRPTISAYSEPADYIRDMIRYRKMSDRDFSVQRATMTLRRVSPALVSLVIRKKRNLTLDRVDEFSRLLALNSTEKFFLRNWVARLEDKDFIEPDTRVRSRKVASTSILSDWINLFVKDFFHLKSVQKDPSLIEKQLLPLVSQKRIQKALEFLLREGHLRRTLRGEIIIDTTLSVTDPGVASRKIRQFHKGALTLARQALDLYAPTERLANTFILALNDQRHQELLQLIKEFAERLQDFAAEASDDPDRLYQMHMNLSPVGGKLE